MTSTGLLLFIAFSFLFVIIHTSDPTSSAYTDKARLIKTRIFKKPKLIMFSNSNSKRQKQHVDQKDLQTNNVISAKQGTEEIEGGIVETIHNPVKIRKVAFELIKCALDEILISFSTVTVFSSQLGKGIMELLEEAALSQHGVKIRMLSPMDNQIKETTQKLKKQQQIHIRY